MENSEEMRLPFALRPRVMSVDEAEALKKILDEPAPPSETPRTEVKEGNPFELISDLIMKGLARTKDLAEIDKKQKTVFEMFTSAGEELGELAEALKITHGRKKKKLVEEPKAEAVDLLICALAIFYAEGGTDAELGVIFNKKLDKWESQS